MEPFGAFESFAPRAERYEYENAPLLVMSVDDLIRIKEHIRRPKEQASLEQLRAIKRERERGG